MTYLFKCPCTQSQLESFIEKVRYGSNTYRELKFSDGSSTEIDIPSEKVISYYINKDKTTLNIYTKYVQYIFSTDLKEYSATSLSSMQEQIIDLQSKINLIMDMLDNK